MVAGSLFTALIERHPDENVQHRDLQSKLALSASDSRGQLLAEAGVYYPAQICEKLIHLKTL